MNGTCGDGSSMRPDPDVLARARRDFGLGFESDNQGTPAEKGKVVLEPIPPSQPPHIGAAGRNTTATEEMTLQLLKRFEQGSISSEECLRLFREHCGEVLNRDQVLAMMKAAEERGKQDKQARTRPPGEIRPSPPIPPLEMFVDPGDVHVPPEQATSWLEMVEREPRPLHALHRASKNAEFGLTVRQVEFLVRQGMMEWCVGTNLPLPPPAKDAKEKFMREVAAVQRLAKVDETIFTDPLIAPVDGLLKGLGRAAVRGLIVKLDRLSSQGVQLTPELVQKTLKEAVMEEAGGDVLLGAKGQPALTIPPLEAENDDEP